MLDVFHDRKVFLTGHTGFKGSWLGLWLHSLGARVSGYSLDPITDPSLFELARVGEILEFDYRADIADLSQLCTSILECEPSVVLHLAAQPLVRESYQDPIGTFRTNVMGTANLLEAVRQAPSVRAVVIVTTDKVYENREWTYPYREIDPLGGHDTYSASKAASEIVTNAYRASFYSEPASPRIASARAGNVIGGGDWSRDRLVPDCLRAFEQGEPVRLRNPGAVRPWQHVLDALCGYLHLTSALLSDEGDRYAGPWNFAPALSGDASVATVAQTLASTWADQAEVILAPEQNQPHEAGLLRLDSTKARRILDWESRWSLPEALNRVVEWHTRFREGFDVRTTTLAQIEEYTASLSK